MVITGAIAVIFISLNRRTVNVNAAHYTRQRSRPLTLRAKTSFVCNQVRHNCAIIAGRRETSPKDDNDLLFIFGNSVAHMLRAVG
ncbi:hypothetical protein BVD23_13335 [Salmonella enterica]|nr:hypothetical protein [Salmonella enterica]EBI8100562.1 hypothetical protein [Salmonella enterica]EBK3005749.1 hypothetical protein [Salmonella enterica]EBK9152395.1 hypothetical protein [Salmonella enterica]EBL6690367.1 hypothetical protein [Salmonella enterica]